MQLCYSDLPDCVYSIDRRITVRIGESCAMHFISFHITTPIHLMLVFLLIMVLAECELVQ